MPEELEQVEDVEVAEEVESPAVEETAAEEPTEVAGDYSPDWLEESAPEPQQQGPSPQEIAAYQQQMAANQQYPQPGYPQQQQQMPPQETDLEKLVRDTRGTITDIMAPQVHQIATSMMNQQMGPYANQMSQFIEGQVQSKVATADRSVRGMYDKVFNKDEGFVGSEAVRNKVKETLQNLRSQAVMAARNGNHMALDMFNDPAFAEITLFAAKKVAGFNSGASSPMSSPYTESAAPAAQSKKSYADELDPDTIEGLKKTYGSHWESRYEKARIEEDKYGDFS
jgi:hypothetical protein